MEGLLLGHFSAIALGCSELDNVSSLLHKFSVPAPKLLPRGGLSLKQSSRSAVHLSQPWSTLILWYRMKLVCLSVSSPLTSPSPRWDKNKWFWWRGQSKSGLYRVDSNFRPFYLAPYTSSIWVVIFLPEEFCFLYALFCTNWKLSFLQEL